MPKKKVVKVKKVAKVKAAKPQKELKFKGSFQDELKLVLNHILDLLKVALIDALRNYIESQVVLSRPASLEDFKNAHKFTIAKHGLSDEQLLENLTPDQKDYVLNSAKLFKQSKNVEAPKAVVQEKTEAPVAPAIQEKVKEETPTKGVFQGLDLL